MAEEETLAAAAGISDATTPTPAETSAALAAQVLITPPITLAQVHHYFQQKQIGPGHDVPAATGAEALNHFRHDGQVQLGRLSRGDSTSNQEPRQPPQLVGQIARPHDDIYPQKFAVMGD